MRVDRRDHLRAFAHRRGAALDRTCPDVADREYAVAAGLEGPATEGDVAAGADEPLPVEGHIGGREPGGVRIGSDEREQMADRLLRFPGGSLPGDRLERSVGTFEPAYRRLAAP